MSRDNGLMIDIKKVCDDIKKNDKFYRINSGGCCVFASLLGDVIRKIYDDVPVRFAVYSFDTANKDINKIRFNVNDNSVREWEQCGLDFYHVLMEFKYKNRWYLCDALDGIDTYAPKSYRNSGKRYKGSLTLTEVKELAADTRWNPAFDRRLIPQLEDTIVQGMGMVAE